MKIVQVVGDETAWQPRWALRANTSRDRSRFTHDPDTDLLTKADDTTWLFPKIQDAQEWARSSGVTILEIPLPFWEV